METQSSLARTRPFRRSRLAVAMSSGLLLTAGLLAGCGGEDRSQSAEKTPLGNQMTQVDADRFATIEGGEVIARINGSPLYRENLLVVKENLGAEVPEDRLVSRMVELRLLADKARAEGLDEAPRTQARIQNAIDNQLANAYLTGYVAGLEISEDELRGAYEEVAAGYADDQQHRAWHILVDTEEKAREILVQLEDGADFAALAKEHSEDPGSAETGGDLGWFSLDQMVEPFAEAVDALQPGEIGEEPVETRFGWHVLKLEDTRHAPAPAFEELRPELEDQVRREAVNDMITELREDATVEIITDDVRSLVEREETDTGEAEPTAPDEASTDMDGLPAEPLKALP